MRLFILAATAHAVGVLDTEAGSSATSLYSDPTKTIETFKDYVGYEKAAKDPRPEATSEKPSKNVATGKPLSEEEVPELSATEMKLLAGAEKKREAGVMKQLAEKETVGEEMQEKREQRADAIVALDQLHRVETAKQFRDFYNDVQDEEFADVKFYEDKAEYATFEPIEKTIGREIKKSMDEKGYTDDLERDYDEAYDYSAKKLSEYGVSQKYNSLKKSASKELDHLEGSYEDGGAALEADLEKGVEAAKKSYSGSAKAGLAEAGHKKVNTDGDKSFMSSLYDCVMTDPQSHGCAVALAQIANKGEVAEEKSEDGLNYLLDKTEDGKRSYDEGHVLRDTAANVKYVEDQYSALKDGDMDKAARHGTVATILSEKKTATEDKDAFKKWVSETADSLSNKAKGLAKSTKHTFSDLKKKAEDENAKADAAALSEEPAALTEVEG